MKFTLKFIYFLAIIILVSACSSEESIDKDLEKPTITINYNQGFPNACEQLVKGQTYNFRAKVSDNLALAAYSLDIHHNFDHHTHDDQQGTCDLDPKKSAVNPFIYLENFSIENQQTDYEIHVSITIPNDIDTGNYHCAYSVTDQTGWQSRTSVDIKIID